MEIYTIDPLIDERWSEFVEQNMRSSLFHQVGWLKALWRTYRYRPIVFTTSPPGSPLDSGLVCCEIQSWVTGRRLVSLPFSDHCDLLAACNENRAALLAHFANRVGRKFKYAEIRPTGPLAMPLGGVWRPGEKFVHHHLSLEAALGDLYNNLHKDCIQRKIRRAEREQLQYSKGRTEVLLRQFYDLLLRTRRRHRLPPQPLKWFLNLMEFMGNRLTIRVVSKDAHAIAAILTLSHSETTTYKYGCSDERYHRFGGMPFLFWMTIQEEKSEGARMLDLGRSDASDAGLLQFKNRLGASGTPLTYWICSRATADEPRSHWIAHVARRLLPPLPSAVLHLPRTILAASGNLFYKHMD
jgi:hypothetical protein